ncbi:MAG: hypothetical protein CR982_08555 [Candidatus Cloacimonadota bacterium]|nr:MAG: hypothetical protein CR982_08555 [Candidatus Cloacimonadota bacterium]PIE78683.1 MAG: hypothetical protein CSA15_06480 [Candidatus Delongbacteria bacterium]
MDKIDFFRDIYGQKIIRENLSKAIVTNRIHHAYLFEGKKGSGRKAIVYEFMKIINCTNRKEDEGYCGSCRECKNLSSMKSENILFLHPEKSELTSAEIKLFEDELELSGKKKGYFSFTPSGRFITINKVKGIKDFTKLFSVDGKSRFIIIDMAERMNKEAQNSLLKILEEPPKGFFFFLITESKELLLPTIISRCNTIEFGNIENRELERYLIDNNYEVSQKAIELSSGSITSLEYLGSEKGKTIISKVSEYIEILNNTTPPETVLALDRFILNSKEEKLEVDLIIEILIETINEICRDSIKKGNYQLGKKYSEITNNLISMLKRNINPRLLFLNHYLSYREEKKIAK